MLGRVLTLRAPDSRTARLLIEAKALLSARDVPMVAQRLTSRLEAPGAVGVMATRYLSPRSREALAAARVSYVDATGNILIRVDDPAVFIQSEGANNDPWRSPDRPTNSLRGRPAARVVRTLADMPPPWKVRELAVTAGTSLGSTVRTLDFLDREALIKRDSSGAVTDVSWEALLERWATDYELARNRPIVRLLEPRGIERVETTLLNSAVRYVISGSLAARWRAPYAEARLALVYTQEPDLLVRQLALRESDTRSNVLIIEPEDDLVFLRTWNQEGRTYAALPQVAVDLLAGPGRNAEEGRALLRWMRDSEAEWRRR